MKLPSSEIPQADRLSDITKVAEAVRSGAQTYQDIADHLGKVERQGRYYRLAAKILGLIDFEYNTASLTPLGVKLLGADTKDKRSIIIDAVFKSKLFQRMIPYFEAHPQGVTKKNLELFMAAVTQKVGPSMMDRRASTVISWLRELDLLDIQGNQYRFKKPPAQIVQKWEFKNVSEPMLPRPGDLKQYDLVAERHNALGNDLQIMISDVSRERADNAHRRLVNLVASRLSTIGVVPRYNQLIDLAAKVNDRPFIFEMKSLTRRNARHQLRRGLGQLYEYRYHQELSDAILVLVIETKLPPEYEWMITYLEQDRNIRLIWDGDSKLYATAKTKRDLPFLNLI